MFKKVSIIITISLVVLMVIFNSILEKQQAEKAVKMAEANTQAEIYESEIAALKAELQTRKNALTANDQDYGGICLAVKVSTFEQLVWITEWIKPYEYPLCVILSSNMTANDQERIFNSLAKHSDWSFMMEGQKAQWLDRTADIYQALKTANLKDSGFVYLEEEVTEEQLAQLKKAGWKGYSHYMGIGSGVDTALYDTELSKIGHVLLTEDNALKTVIEDAILNSKTFILAVQMEDLNKEFSRESIERILTTLQEDYIQTNDLKKVSLKTYLQDFEDSKVLREKMQKEYEKFEEKCIKDIENLENNILQMYEALK